MAATKIEDVSNQVREFWSDLFVEELRDQTLLPALVNKDYSGEIKNTGDTVKVTQVNKPNGQLLDIDNSGAAHNADSFDTETLSTSQISVIADKRAVGAYEMEDLVMLQSQIRDQDSEIRSALRAAVEEQINDYLYSLVSPSTSSPDHLRNSIANYDASELLAVRQLAAEAKWRKDKAWWLLLSPQYYNDILSASTLTSSDYVCFLYTSDAPDVLQCSVLCGRVTL